MGSKFFTQRFYLDNPIDRFTNVGGDHFVGPFRSFWVSDTNNSKFKCDLVIDPRSDRGRGIPLRLNQCQSITGKAESACIEFKVSQPGVWVDITFSQDDEITVGSVVVDITGQVALTDGSRFYSNVYTITPTPAVLIPANDLRYSATLQWKFGPSIWVGDAAFLALPNYQETCIEVKPGETFTWNNTSPLSARTDVSNAKFCLLEELK